MQIYNIFSPNFDKKKRSKKAIKVIVIHYTGMQSEREALNRLCDLKSKVSSHFFINKNGKIYNLVKENKVAWHAGKSCWRNFKNLNKNSIGIELANKGHEFGYTSFKKKQISSLIIVIKNIIKKYKIEKKNIVGHSDIAPLRKMDPGEKFPWKSLAKKNIGIWHNIKKNQLKDYRKIKINDKKEKINFIKNLNKIGYCLSVNTNNKNLYNKNLKAFQRHFRGELVNGILDKECTIIAEKLSKKL
jgi:N-acetylmuramoyl-L-alanine amidase